MYRTSESEAVRATVNVFRKDQYDAEMSKARVKEISKQVRRGIIMGIAAVGLCAAAWFIEDPATSVNKAIDKYNNDKLGQPVVAPGK